MLIYKRWAHGLFSVRLPSSLFYAGEGGSLLLLTGRRFDVDRAKGRGAGPRTRTPPASRLSQCMFVFPDACTRHAFFQDLSGSSSSSSTLAEWIVSPFHPVYPVKFVWVWKLGLSERCFFFVFWYTGTLCSTLYFLQFDGNAIISRLIPW
jgi:hypothetical protein